MTISPPDAPGGGVIQIAASEALRRVDAFLESVQSDRRAADRFFDTIPVKPELFENGAPDPFRIAEFEPQSDGRRRMRVRADSVTFDGVRQNLNTASFHLRSCGFSLGFDDSIDKIAGLGPEGSQVCDDGHAGLNIHEMETRQDQEDLGFCFVMNEIQSTSGFAWTVHTAPKAATSYLRMDKIFELFGFRSSLHCQYHGGESCFWRTLYAAADLEARQTVMQWFYQDQGHIRGAIAELANAEGLVNRYDLTFFPVTHHDAQESSTLARQANVGPQEFLMVASLHPAIRAAAEPLFSDGHFGPAVVEAAKALADLIRDRCGLTTDGAQLVNEAFSEKNPLLLLGDTGTQSGRDTHNGFRSLAAGVYLGIRNPLSHNRVQLGREEAEEMLSTISLVARRVSSGKRL